MSRSTIEESEGFPWTFRCHTPGIDLAAWVIERRADVEAALHANGALLFRGFAVHGQEQFQACVGVLAPDPLAYMYRSTPRTAVGANVYTATEYPARSTIPLHCENAYQRDWPTRLMFYCAQPALEGGATTVARMTRVTARLSDALVDEFEKRRVMYVRNYMPNVDLPWQTVFQTQRRDEVDAYCRDNEIEVEWKSDEQLRTRQVCQGVLRDPESGGRVWFNQAHLFNIAAMERRARLALLETFGEANLPRNSYFGDGGRIEEATIAQVSAAFDVEAVPIQWQRGDVALLDNILVAHGRLPYSGPRKVLVAMSSPHSRTTKPARSARAAGAQGDSDEL